MSFSSQLPVLTLCFAATVFGMGGCAASRPVHNSSLSIPATSPGLPGADAVLPIPVRANVMHWYGCVLRGLAERDEADLWQARLRFLRLPEIRQGLYSKRLLVQAPVETLSQMTGTNKGPAATTSWENALATVAVFLGARTVEASSGGYVISGGVALGLDLSLLGVSNGGVDRVLFSESRLFSYLGIRPVRSNWAAYPEKPRRASDLKWLSPVPDGR